MWLPRTRGGILSVYKSISYNIFEKYLGCDYYHRPNCFAYTFPHY